MYAYPDAGKRFALGYTPFQVIFSLEGQHHKTTELKKKLQKL